MYISKFRHIRVYVIFKGKLMKLSISRLRMYTVINEQESNDFLRRQIQCDDKDIFLCTVVKLEKTWPLVFIFCKDVTQ
jgi:hypothetical protein